MAIAKKLGDEISRSSPSSSSSSLNEALLNSTMCIIGLQVHVHIQDGSIFSGIFYTISLENEFGIVLKNAKLTKKGTSKSNVAIGKTVETLVILSSNIVQIVAEGVSISSNIAANIVGENVVPAMAGFPPEPCSFIANTPTISGIEKSANHRRNCGKLENCLENKVKTFKSRKDQEPRGPAPICNEDAMKEPRRREEIGVAQNKHNHSSLKHQRQARARILKCSKRNTAVHQKDNVYPQSSSSSLDSTFDRVKPIEEEKVMPEPTSNSFHDAADNPPSTALDENSEIGQGSVASTNRLLPTQVIDPVGKAKEFKLNPGAKIFSPSLTKRVSSTSCGMTPVVSNMGYVPINTPMLHVPEAVQPMVGPIINTGQPQRFTSQYHSVQASPMLVNPNPQVIVGRSGQLMYMQPISQDLVQGAPHQSHLPSRPLFPPQQLQYPKHPNLIAMQQLYAPQPFAGIGHQPYAVMPTDIPHMQPPFPTNRSMPVPVPNGFYGRKFL